MARQPRPVPFVGSAGATGRCNGSAVLHLKFRPFRCIGRLIGSCLLPSATGRDGRGLKTEA